MGTPCGLKGRRETSRRDYWLFDDPEYYIPGAEQSQAEGMRKDSEKKVIFLLSGCDSGQKDAVPGKNEFYVKKLRKKA